MKFLNQQGRLILITLLNITGALLGNWVTNLYEAPLKNFFGKYYFAVLPGLFILIILLLVWITLRDSGISEQDSLVSKKVPSGARKRLIQYLEQLYSIRHKNKLDDRLALNLEFKYSQEGTEKEYVDKYFLQTAKSDKDIQAGLLELSKRYRYLLILGQPGAGKSTLLLDLALSMLNDQQVIDGDKAIPIVFNLAYWNDRFKSDFAGWLEQYMVDEKICSRKTANRLIRTRKLIPLLDGLDEIANINVSRSDAPKNTAGETGAFAECLGDIETYLSHYNPENLVITSRIEDYKKINKNAPIHAQITVKALTKDQLQDTLATALTDSKTIASRPYSNTVAVQNISGLLNKFPHLAEVLCTPFYFNLACQVFGSINMENAIPSDIEEFKKFLVEKFVKNALGDQGNKKALSIEKSTKCLEDLADLLMIGSQYTRVQRAERKGFSPSDLFDISWQSKSWIIYLVITNTINGIFLGLYFWFFLGNSSYILQGALIGFLNYFLNRPVNFLVIKVYSFRRIKSNPMPNPIMFRIINNGVFNIMFAVAILIVAKFFKGPYVDMGLKILFANFSVSVIHGYLFNLILKFNRTSAATRRIHSPLGVLLSGMIIIMNETFVFIFLGVNLTEFVSAPPNFLFLGGIIIGKLFVYSKIFSRLITRTIKVSTGIIPFRHVRFLNFATERRILEHDGKNWRFRHKILHDYFYYNKNSGKKGSRKLKITTGWW